MVSVRKYAQKRELGGSPKRSGHCKQGVSSDVPLCQRPGQDVREKGEQALICKPGNLLIVGRRRASGVSTSSKISKETRDLQACMGLFLLL